MQHSFTQTSPTRQDMKIRGKENHYVCGIWYSFCGRIIQRNPTLYVQIHCTWERSHSVHSNLFAIKRPLFHYPKTFISLSTTFSLSLCFFFALSHRVSSFSPSLPCIFALTSSSSSLPSSSLSLKPSFVWNRADFTSRGFLNCAHV